MNRISSHWSRVFAVRSTEELVAFACSIELMSSTGIVLLLPVRISEDITSRPVTTDHSPGQRRACQLVLARTVVQAPCQISFGLVSSRAPGAPSSRPYPEALTPPNGARGSERVKSLINTIPDSISLATRRALTRSRLQTAALRPKSVILAR